MKYRTYQLIGDCYTEPTYTEAPYWKSKKQIKEYIENDKDVERITEYKTNFTNKGDYKIDIGILTKNSEEIFF